QGDLVVELAADLLDVAVRAGEQPGDVGRGGGGCLWRGLPVLVSGDQPDVIVAHDAQDAGCCRERSTWQMRTRSSAQAPGRRSPRPVRSFVRARLRAHWATVDPARLSAVSGPCLSLDWVTACDALRLMHSG